MKHLIIVLTLLFSTTLHSQQPPKVLIVFFDGLRPDYITPELMPNLVAFRKKGSYGTDHHSVFPTVTRVNASSYSTGSYPGTHGLMGNSVYFPSVSTNKALNTGEAEELNKIAAATNGHLLTAISLGELMQSVGKKMMVFSSGSTGQAMMQNHTVSGGAIVNPALVLPSSFQDTLINEIGPIPPSSKPNTARHQWITDALLKFGFAENGPQVSAIWFSDPDGTAHSDGIGSATANASIQSVDAQFGRIVKEIEARKMSINILVSTDHGFVTHIGKENVTGLLIREGIKKDRDSEDVVLAGGAIYVKDHDVTVIKRIVSLLQQQPWVGGIFTRGREAGKTEGVMEGTLSFSSIHWDHKERSADILVDVNWNDEANAAGYKGTSFAGGVAGHGSLSPYEVHIPLVVGGPAFKKSFTSSLPTSNVDIVPTVLSILKMPVPETMDGRVMDELLVNGNKQPKKVIKEMVKTSVQQPWGTYELQLERSVIGKYIYVNFARIIRTVHTQP